MNSKSKLWISVTLLVLGGFGLASTATANAQADVDLVEADFATLAPTSWATNDTQSITIITNQPFRQTLFVRNNPGSGFVGIRVCIRRNGKEMDRILSVAPGKQRRVPVPKGATVFLADVGDGKNASGTWWLN